MKTSRILIAAWLAGAMASAAGKPIVVARDAAPEALYALGDIHGDMERAVSLLTAAHLVQGNAWTGGRSVLVVTGDMIDKGPHPVEVLRFLAALRDAAPKTGGDVIVLSGNHEAEFLADSSSSKAQDFASCLKKSGLNAKDVATCHTDVGEFLCSLPYAARVGDWFFSHAGDTGGRTVARIEAASSETSILEARLGEEKKWFAAPDEHRLLESYAAALGVRHMVQGHQHNEVRFADGVERHTGEMFQRWGLLFLIDVGMSRDIGDSKGAILRIAKGKASAVCPDGKQTLLWDDANPLDFGRAAPCR